MTDDELDRAIGGFLAERRAGIAAMARPADLAAAQAVAVRPRRLVPGVSRGRQVLVVAVLLLLGLVVGASIAGGQLLRPKPVAVVVTDASPAPSTSTTSFEPSPSANPSPSSGSVTGRMSTANSVWLRDGRLLILLGNVNNGAEIWDPSTGTTTPTGSTGGPHSRPTLTLLDDGRVLVAGEETSAEIYDPVTGSFTPSRSKLHARGSCHCGIRYAKASQSFATLLADGKVLIAGGRENMNPEIYDPVSDTVTETPPLPIDVSRGTATRLLEGRVLITGLRHAVLYDPATNRFVTTGSPTTSDTASATLLADGRVLLTGPTLRADSDPAEVYDPAAGAFKPLDVKVSPYATTIGLRDGRVLVIGPWMSSSVPARRDASGLLDPATGTFVTIPSPVDNDLPVTAAAQLADGRVLIVETDGAVGSTAPPSQFFDPTVRAAATALAFLAHEKVTATQVAKLLTAVGSDPSGTIPLNLTNLSFLMATEQDWLINQPIPACLRSAYVAYSAALTSTKTLTARMETAIANRDTASLHALTGQLESVTTGFTNALTEANAATATCS
jgi:hypothetical protein